MASLQELMAASALVVTLERIARSGVLPAADEANIRLLICRACRAFEIPTVAERLIADEPLKFELVR